MKEKNSTNNLKFVSYTPPGGPPQITPPSKEIYSIMGEANIMKMLEDFYLALGLSSIRDMFPTNLKEASKKSGLFFVFLLGGPSKYQEKHGSPMLRQRHVKFQIDEDGRRVWVECFFKILETAPEKYEFPAQHIDVFKNFLNEFSKWMVNSKKS